MILVIDDNEDIRFTVTEICEFGGWKADAYANGREGAAAFYPGKHELVMVDYHMPEWDGLETVRAIRKRDPSIPIIVLTVDDRMELVAKFTDAGATDFAQKPIKAADLISRIRLNMKMAKLQDDHQSAFVEKGINEDTLRQIKSHLRHQTEARTINELKQELPVSYQTVHRYLNYMVDMGEVEIEAHYGKKGRPKNKYKAI
ncbi:response regulator [Pontibacillus salicampi]|uniref:Response regulator n=1 Tax=Pontibacillus salicampi TaxID=1449801 RepID=A0ABV6LSK8_9BACI